MKVNFYKSIICLIVIIKSGQTLKCWSCSSIFEAGCDDPFTPEGFTMESHNFLSSCDLLVNGSLEDRRLMDQIFGPDSKPYCRKTVIKRNGMTIVHRGCSYGVAMKDCADPRYEKCVSSACFEDGCNTGSSLSPISLLFIPFYIVIVFFFFSFLL